MFPCKNKKAQPVGSKVRHGSFCQSRQLRQVAFQTKLHVRKCMLRQIFLSWREVVKSGQQCLHNSAYDACQRSTYLRLPCQHRRIHATVNKSLEGIASVRVQEGSHKIGRRMPHPLQFFGLRKHAHAHVLASRTPRRGPGVSWMPQFHALDCHGFQHYILFFLLGARTLLGRY